MHSCSLILALILLQPISQILAQSKTQKHSRGELVMGFGSMKLSGKTAETLNDGWSLNTKLHVAVIPWVKGLRVGIDYADGTNVFRLNSEERVAIREYERVTYENGRETGRETIDKVYCGLSRFLFSLKWYPINKGIYQPASDTWVRPYVSGGYAFNRISTIDEGGAVAWGGAAYYNIGVDLTVPKWSQDTAGVFFRFEVVTGIVPNWDVRIFPELRPVNEGRYRLITLGLGVSFF